MFGKKLWGNLLTVTLFPTHSQGGIKVIYLEPNWKFGEGKRFILNHIFVAVNQPQTAGTHATK